MKRNDKDELRTIVLDRARALRKTAVHNKDGDLSSHELEQLERLARVLEIQNQFRPQPPRNRWPVVLVAVITLLTISVLLFARVSETDIKLDLTVSGLEFITPDPQVFAQTLELSSFGISPVKEIRVPRTRHKPNRMIRHNASAISLSPVANSIPQSTVTFSVPPLMAGARVWVNSMGAPNHYQISINGIDQPLKVDVNGRVQLGLPNAPAETFEVPSPRSFLIGPESSRIDLDLVFLPSKTPILLPLLVSKLSFFRIDEWINFQQTIIRKLSTIISGTLYFEALGGKRRVFRSGEELHFGSCQGTISRLQLEKGVAKLQFRGRVQGMAEGSDEHRHSLMPTYLEWLKTRHGLSLLWGTTVYITLLLMAVMRWWGLQI